MKKVLPILAGVLLLGGSAALVIVAERRGWLPGAGGSGSSESCPHGLSRENCPFCDPSLVESLGQCGGHGVPEAFCTRCNSSLVVAFKKVGDWCAEHKLPESQCTICNPGVQGSGEALIPSIDLVPAPDVARSRRAPSVSCSTNDLRVQFTSTEIAAQAGLEYARVESREITQSVISNAEVTFDQNRYSHLSSRAPGVVREVMTDLGQSVESRPVYCDAIKETLHACGWCGWRLHSGTFSHWMEATVVPECDDARRIALGSFNRRSTNYAQVLG